MTRVLPPHPNVDHLKNEAKALLKAHKSGEPATCKTIRLLHRFRDASDEKILAAELALNEAQFALAMDYGFKDWEDLRGHILKLSGRPDFEDHPRPGALLIENPPAGKGNSNRYARGFVMGLSHCGTECDYETIMGDSGLAFILQADEYVTPWGKPVKQVDIGWWPLAWWGALMRLDFVGKAVGRELIRLPIDIEQRRSDPTRHYQEHVEKLVVEALHSDRLPLAIYDHCWVVTGRDDGDPPLLGVRSVFDGHEQHRLEDYPDEVIIPGKQINRLSRGEVDKQALHHAITLGKDGAAELARSIPRCSAQGIKPAGGRYTGKAAFALWAKLLRDTELWGEHFYHANMVGHLRINRQSALPYLRAMAERHKRAAASHLHAAAGMYENVLGELAKADTSKEVMASTDGREALAKLIESFAALEAEAVNEMERAVAAME